MKSLRFLITGLSLSVAAAAAHSAALTNANIDLRETLYQMSFADLTFAGARNDRSDVLHFHGGVGDSGTFGITGFPPGFAGVSVEPASGMSVSGLQPADASGVVRYTAAIVGPSAQTLRQSWINNGLLTSGVTAGGLRFLEFNSKNIGFLRPGGEFDFTVTIPGDWSTFGTATGDVEFLGINPDFSITRNFIYDAASDTTTFAAVDSNYRLNATDVDFVLYGAPVPEPQARAAMLVGLLPMLGFAHRRRRAGGSRS
ncbi:MAG: hypothetical protein ABW032_11810 [Burkholderiaceae bacterium]